jgi:hypothetical protein
MSTTTIPVSTAWIAARRRRRPGLGTRAPRLGGIEPRKHVTRHAHTANNLVGGIGVRSVDDWLMDVFERDVAESSSPQNLLDLGRLR